MQTKRGLITAYGIPIILYALICVLPFAAYATDAEPEFNFNAAIQAAGAMPRLYGVIVSWNGKLVLELGGQEARYVRRPAVTC